MIWQSPDPWELAKEMTLGIGFGEAAEEIWAGAVRNRLACRKAKGFLDRMTQLVKGYYLFPVYLH